MLLQSPLYEYIFNFSVARIIFIDVTSMFKKLRSMSGKTSSEYSVNYEENILI